MNWNNTELDNSMPLTVRAARQVGSILSSRSQVQSGQTGV
jgi:hypothetical protein